MSDIQEIMDTEERFIRQVDDLQSFVEDLEGYINQAKSFIDDIYSQLDNWDGGDRLADMDFNDEFENINSQANDLSYDAASVNSYVANAQKIFREIQYLTEKNSSASI